MLLPTGILWTLLPFLCSATTSIPISCTVDDDNLCITNELGPILFPGSPSSRASRNEDVWQCDVRAWTRSPDLHPGKAVPAEARLALNGTACGDVVGWEVGLRYLERAIIKLKADGVEFPVKPVRPKRNMTERMGSMNEWNSVWSTRELHDHGEEDEYEKAARQYNQAMKNESLFKVEGVERVVYDVTKKMPWDMVDPQYVDTVHGFAVHLPLVSYPPVEEFRYYSSSEGQHEQMLGTEALSEYYHLITLRNGTTIDIPSGNVAIIPLASPVARPESSFDNVNLHRAQGPVHWPHAIDFPSTRREKLSDEVEEEYWMPGGRIAPLCDEGNQANFSFSINSSIEKPVVGSNITLSITLTRKGNGSQFPVYLDIAHATKRNITFAYDYISTKDQYTALTQRDRHTSFPGNGFETQRMVLTPDQTGLEKEKKDREQIFADEGRSLGMESYWPMTDNMARYKFPEDAAEKDEWTFNVTVPSEYNLYPSFEKTFEMVRSGLAFSLYSRFACDIPISSAQKRAAAIGNEHSNDAKARSAGRDSSWTEYFLPLDRDPEVDWTLAQRTFQHTTVIHLDIRPAGDSESSNGAVHYLDISATGPVLSDEIADKVEYPILNQAKRLEDSVEMKRIKWDAWEGARRTGWCHRVGITQGENEERCYNANGGGGGMLAGRMWLSATMPLVEKKDKQDAKLGLVVQV